MIKIKKLTYKYEGEEEIFQNINLEIDKGIYILSGRNGAGKSTFLNLISGLDKEFVAANKETEIEVDGKFIFLNEESFFPDVLYEMDIAKYIFKINDLKIDSEYKPLYSNKPIGKYSLGEKKLAVLRILSYLNVKNIFLDEYLTNIDEENMEEVFGILESLKEKGCLIIVASNDKSVKKRIENKLEIIDKGVRVIKNEG